MVRQKGKKRKYINNLQIGILTAVAAGMVNVASVIAFFTFSSNVTGHMAIFSEQLIQGNWHQVMIVMLWLFMFLFGAFTANFLVNRFERYGTWISHSMPVFIEIILLMCIAFYGINYYQDHLLETEMMVACLLFAMGNQNGMVATITNSVVKTTHVTGLFTDLGMEISLLLHKKHRHNKVLRKKFKLHVAIAVFYFLGGAIGGRIFHQYGFMVFYVVAAILVFIIFYDFLIIYTYLIQKRIKQFRQNPEKKSYVKFIKVKP